MEFKDLLNKNVSDTNDLAKLLPRMKVNDVILLNLLYFLYYFTNCAFYSELKNLKIFNYEFSSDKFKMFHLTYHIGKE